MEINRKIILQLVALIILFALFPLSFWIADRHEVIMARYQVDKIIHFSAGFLVAFFLRVRLHLNLWGVIIATLLVGAGWEIFEYYATIAFRWPLTDFSREHYALDTLLDQVAVGFGAAVFWPVGRGEDRF